MTALNRLIITILFGWLGIHKFFDKKPIQGFIYMFTLGLLFFGWIIDIVMAIQFYLKIRVNRIEQVSMVLGIVFSLMLFLGCIGGLLDKDFDAFSFILSLISCVSIFKVFVIDNKKNELSYANLNYTHKHLKPSDSNIITKNMTSNEKNNINFDDNSVDDYNLMSRIYRYSNNEKSEESIEKLGEEAIEELEEENINNSPIKNSGYLTGKFYDEENLILEKYKDLKTPQYIIIQINEQLNPTGDFYYVDDMVELSNQYKDKYLDSADFYPFNSYWAQIRDLNEYQLRWYLFWRKEFLNGNVLDTDISYIFIFAYELICYTFNQKASFNISVLEKLYNSYKELYPKLSNYIPEWIEDMLSEVGYYYNQNDSDIKVVEEDPLVNSLTTNTDLDKINITVWKKHYNESKSDLTNKQLSLIYGNQKFTNRVKKYAGFLAKYYIDNKIDIINKWFEVRVVTEKKRLFDSVPSSLQRREGTFKCKRYFSNKTFEHDLNQITKLCYDLLFPQNGRTENEYVISQYEDGRYELPKDFFYLHFKTKQKKKDSLVNEENPTPREFTIDMSVIEKSDSSFNYVETKHKQLIFNKEEKEFLRKFDSGLFDKKDAQQYFIKKGIMLNVFIKNFNEKYYSEINKEIIIVDDKNLRLNIEVEEFIND